MDHQTILKPSALLKMKVHPKLCQNVAILRSIVRNVVMIEEEKFYRIFPSITSSTIKHFLGPPIEGVVLQVEQKHSYVATKYCIAR